MAKPLCGTVVTYDALKDPEARMASQLADIHLRARRIVENELVALREQYGDPQTTVRRSV